MPQLKVRGVELIRLCEMSKPMIDELEEVLKCPRNYFTIESINSTFIMDGEIAMNYPVVEIDWFDRGQEIQDKVAKIVTNYIHKAGYESVDIIFTVLQEKKYYENGEHF
jgi:hypothetical protein